MEASVGLVRFFLNSNQKKGRDEASPPAPLQRERGDSKLRGCDSQDRGIQIKSVKSVKSVGQERRGRSNWGVQFDVQKNRYPNKCAVALLR